MRIALILFFAASSAEARSVFLNNVNIDGVQSQHFENCTVDIDAQSNVRLTCNGYKVQVAQQPPPSPAALTQRYWLVTQNPTPSMDQYDIEILVNSQTVKRVQSKDESVYLEITRFLHPGTNQVYIVAKKNLDGGVRRSTSPQHSSRVIIGEGTVNEKTIVIDKQLLDYKRSAAESQDFADSFTIEAR